MTTDENNTGISAIQQQKNLSKDLPIDPQKQVHSEVLQRLEHKMDVIMGVPPAMNDQCRLAFFTWLCSLSPLVYCCIEQFMTHTDRLWDKLGINAARMAINGVVMTI